ncbi:MAG: hypothetical protein AAGA61_07470 [Pseudomonadota bacterium]
MTQGFSDSGATQVRPDDEDCGTDAYAPAEHISIGEDTVVPPEAPDERIWRRVLAGPEPGTSTEIVFFREGWLRLRTGTHAGVDSERFVEIGFLDPKFSGRWRLHKLWLSLSVLCLVCLPLLWLVNTLNLAVPMLGNNAAAVLIALSVAAGLFTVAALTMLVRTARRSITFVTRTGRVPAVQLTALPGGRSRINRLARDIRTAIRKTPAITADGSGGLRAEMQGHYRLRDAGVISADLCDEGTRRILAQFG